MKRNIGLLLVVTIMLILVGCNGRQDDVNDKSLVVLYDQAINAGVGEADAVLAQVEKTLEDGGSSVLQTAYDHTVILNNVVKENGFTLEYDDWGWAESLIQKQTLAFVAEDGADVLIGETQMPGYAMQGLLKPFPEELATYIRENLLPAAYKPMEFDGNIYGVATQPSVSLLVYNNAIMEDVFGANYEPPQTWAEWLDDMEAVKAKDYVPGGVYAGPNAGGYLRFSAFQQQVGGGFVDENNYPDLDTDENKQALQFLKDIADLNPNGMITSSSSNTMVDQFLNGNMAYYVDGSYNPTTCYVYPALTEGCGVAPLPLPSLDAEEQFVTIGASFLSIPEYIPDHKVDVAFKYIEAAISEEAQEPILSSQIRIPMNKNVYPDGFFDDNPLLSTYYNSMLSENVGGLPTFTYENSKSWQQVGYMYIKVATTSMTIDEILSDAQSTLEEYYRRNE